MTYCLAASLRAGLVFAADTRTNAGLDHVNSFRKMHSFVWEGDRVMVLLSAGNLATTQAVVTHLQREAEDGGPLSEVKHLSDAAEHVGQVSQQVQQRYRSTDSANPVSLEATFILGGQIGGEAPSTFLIYPQGNFITEYGGLFEHSVKAAVRLAEIADEATAPLERDCCIAGMLFHDIGKIAPAFSETGLLRSKDHPFLIGAVLSDALDMLRLVDRPAWEVMHYVFGVIAGTYDDSRIPLTKFIRTIDQYHAAEDARRRACQVPYDCVPVE